MGAHLALDRLGWGDSEDNSGFGQVPDTELSKVNGHHLTSRLHGISEDTVSIMKATESILRKNHFATCCATHFPWAKEQRCSLFVQHSFQWGFMFKGRRNRQPAITRHTNRNSLGKEGHKEPSEKQGILLSRTMHVLMLIREAQKAETCCAAEQACNVKDKREGESL